MLREIQKKPETMRVSGFLKFFKYTYFFNNLCTSFSLIGKNLSAIGPIRNAQTIVPIPNTPPRRTPIITKEKSTMTRQMPKGFLVLSDTTTPTRSFGPVPASDLMTIVIPNASMKQPRIKEIKRTTKEEESLIIPPNNQLKKSIIGPPKNIQINVPVLI